MHAPAPPPSLLTNREIALIFWGLVSLALVLSKKETRSALIRLIGVATHWRLLLPTLLLAGYVIVVCALAARYGWWSAWLWKDASLWTLTTGLVLCFRNVAKPSPGSIAGPVLADSFKVLVLVHFVVSEFPFSLLVELVLVPFLFLVVGVTAVAKTQNEPRVVAVLEWVLAGTGIAMFWHAIVGAYRTWSVFGSTTTAYKIALPVVLTIAVLPLAYLFALYGRYEQAVLSLRFGPEKPKDVMSYGRRRVVQRCRFNRHRYHQLATTLRWELSQATSRAEVDAVIAKLTAQADDHEQQSHPSP